MSVEESRPSPLLRAGFTCSAIQTGFGLAAAVLLDVTLARPVLLPSFMKLAGQWNFSMPGWLDQVLPRLHHAGDVAGECRDVKV